jgi:CheY-like chemotaxis protein
LGTGSTFRFRIPTDILPTPPSMADLGNTSETVMQYDIGPILVVEDNAVNRRVVRLMLKHMGQDPVVVESGEAALEALQKEFFEIIFMDVQMPAMDGLEATRRIRALFEQHGETQPYIVALTAYAQESDREQCMKNGMNDFISKPLRRGDLHRLFTRISATTRPLA